MNFLSPWFLLGAALIAGPILAHLIRRATKTRVSFSAMRFLNPSPPKLDRRNRVQHPWLLLLRCLIVGFLALAFARPFLKQELPSANTPAIPQSVVAVLDESATMQRTGLWDAARKKVYDLADNLGPHDQFALIASSGGATELVSREKWMSTPAAERGTLVRAALADRQPGWGPKNLDTAIEAAAGEWEQMAEATNAVSKKKIVVISDFTNGARVTGLAGLPWPKGSEVDLQPVNPTNAGDAGLQWLGWTDTDNGPAVRVRVVQNAKSTATAMSVQLRDAATNTAIGAPQKLTVEPKDAQIVLLPVPKEAVGKPMRAELSGDQEPYDNTVWVVRPAPRDMELVYYGGQAANDIKHARYYLERAVLGWKDPAVKLVAAEDAAQAPEPAKAAAQFFVIAGRLDQAELEKVRRQIQNGSFAIVLLNDPAMVDTAAALLGETGWTAVKPTEKNALFGQIDFQHPLFSLFADPHYSDFTHIEFWQPQSVKLPEKTAAMVAAKFDDGSPAVMEAPLGKGRVVIWGGDWAPVASQWVLSTKFVPWLETLFERAAGGAARLAIAEIGDTDKLLGGQPGQWRPLANPTAAFVETAPTLPGVYQLQQGDAIRTVALEVPAAATDISPMPTDWEKLGVPLHAQPLTAAAPLAAPLGQDQTASVIEARQKLWRWLLLGAVILLALESIYSLVLSRRNDHNPNEAAT
ncbi:MAG TPA: BatA domain-containing protein [Opitutales bacterium]|nr:BatA domain-containing protein [Opitutales bacterium]